VPFLSSFIAAAVVPDSSLPTLSIPCSWITARMWWLRRRLWWGWPASWGQAARALTVTL
jgi:hypothetical protein